MNPDDFRPFHDDHFALNHGIDHRAQTLAVLAQVGGATFPQEYALYAMGKL